MEFKLVTKRAEIIESTSSTVALRVILIGSRSKKRKSAMILNCATTIGTVALCTALESRVAMKLLEFPPA